MPEVSRRTFLGAGVAAASVGPAAAAVADGTTTLDVTCTLNGVARSWKVHPDATALELIRIQARLTGAKEVCGHGACGACAIDLDGVVVNACVLPATSLHGTTVRTVEGLDNHVMQRAFVAADALQCGYCTPGFVVEAARFYDDRQAQRPGVEPTTEAVADALCGHLCRCAAYPGIVQAVKDACAGRVPAKVDAVRVDAQEKVTGAATYTTDVQLEGQLEGRILRSPHPHGRLVRLDTTAAQALPGVKAIHVLIQPGQRVRFRGQEVAAVAAVDARTARAAIAAMVADWEVLPHAIGLDAASLPDAPRVYPEVEDVAQAGEFPIPPARWTGNVRGPIDASLFLREGAARRATPLVQGVWTTAAQSHTALEPHACVADWRGDGLRMYVSTQAGWDLAEDLAERYDLRRERVQVLCPYVGGAFGAKSEFEPHIAIAVALSRVSGLPVRVVLDREEELSVGGYRAAQRIRMRLAVAPDGTPEGLEALTEADSGVAIGANVGGLYRLLYPFPEKRLLDWDVVTFAPSARAFRAPGGPPALWAIEQAIDEAADKLGFDALALRRQWDPTWAPLYDHVAAMPMWRDRGATPTEGRFRRGVGVAAGGWYYVVQVNVIVEIEATRDGLIVRTGGQDIGTGTRTVLATTLAESLGLDRARITVSLGDSDLPRGPMAGGSRTTASYVPAVLSAADALIEALGHPGPARRFTPGVGWTDADGAPVSWDAVFTALTPTLVRSRRPADRGGYALPFGVAGFRMGRKMAGTVHLAEVEVDTWTGRVVVSRYHAHFRVGRLATPALARAQCTGGILQGIGFALHEERRTDPDGRITTLNLEDYRILGIGDAPPITLDFDETGFEHVDGGGIGLAEVCTVPVAAAIGNAVAHATGVRFRDLPLHPHRVRAGLAT